MKTLLILFLVFGVVAWFSNNSKATELSITEVPKEFIYDGCSMFPDLNYFECCYEHDQKYFFGGTWQQRLEADKELYQCVKAKGGTPHHALAGFMWAGVRLGGASFLPTSFRWGFGRDIY